MSVRFTWRGPEFERQLPGILNDALTEAAAVGADSAARQIEPRPVASFVKGGGNLARVRIGAGGGVVSKPGQSPTTQKGILRQSVSSTRAKNLRAAIGTGLKYGRWLELGTSKMAARPWLKRGVLKSRRQMGRVFLRNAKAGFQRISLGGGG